MLTKILLASCLLVTSMASQASIIEYAGYKRDTSGTCTDTQKDCKYNIVTGGGLEWLMWDVTKGMSINTATDLFTDGWLLADNSKMADLLNAFEFGSAIYISEEDAEVFNGKRWDEQEAGPFLEFVKLFGDTYDRDMCTLIRTTYCYKGEYSLSTQAIYGSDSDSNGYYNVVLISDDISYVWGDGKLSLNGASADMYEQFSWRANKSYSRPEFGVALVRNARETSAEVSVPASSSLLVMGLFALGFRRRQVLSH